MVNINDRTGIFSGLVNQGIRKYFKNHPIRDNSEVLDKINEKLEDLDRLVQRLSEKTAETVIELDTK